MAPLIPYVEVPELPLRFLPLQFLSQLPGIGAMFDPRHPPSIKPFGTLVALGVYIGSVVAMRHARERKLDDKVMSEVIFWVVGIGFIGGHMLDAIFYHPSRLASDPLYLFKLWDGLSSYGGFIGAVIGALLWRWSRKRPVLPFIECVNSAFPLAWVFGRMGCSSVHDHPGHLSDAWFAVRWPMPGGGVVGRLDLGLIEMVLTIPLAIAFLVLWRRKPNRPLGFYSGWMCVAYAPVRFLLDFLREGDGTGPLAGDARYGGLTPAQWACFGLFALGVFMVTKARHAAATAPAEESAGSGDSGPASDPDADEPGGEAPVSDR